MKMVGEGKVRVWRDVEGEEEGRDDCFCLIDASVLNCNI